MPLKTTEEKEEIKQATASVAATKLPSTDAALTAVFSELDGILH